MWFYNKQQNEKQFNESLAKRFDETMVQAYPAVNYCAQAIYIQKDYLERNIMIAKNQNPYNYQSTFKYQNRQTRLDDIFYARQYINCFKTGLIYSILTTQLSQVNFPRSNSAYSCTNIACRCEFPQMASRISSL